MVGPSVPLFGFTYTELRDRLYVDMQPCDHCVDIREPGVDGGRLSGRISFNNRLVCSQVHHRRFRVHAVTNYASGRNHGKSSTRVWIGFPVQRKTGRTMTPVDRQHNVQRYATIRIRPRHAETNISGWTIDTIKKVRFARSFCFPGVYSRHG